MSTARRLLVSLVLAAGLAISASASAAPASPAWSIQSLSVPTNFAPGDTNASYEVFLTNSGGKVADGTPITITDTLPAGLGVKEVSLSPVKISGVDIGKACKTETTGEAVSVSCEVTDALLPEAEPARLYPGDGLVLEIKVSVPPNAAGALVNQVKVEGGGAATVTAHSENQASPEDPPAGFEEFKAKLTGPDGLPMSGADSHPYQYTTSFGVNLVRAPAASAAKFVPAQGSLKEIEVALPPGLAGNPTATPRCTAQQFNSFHSFVAPLREIFVSPSNCPTGSVVGMAVVQQLEGQRFFVRLPIYNLVPPKGMPAQFGFLTVGLPNYINTRVRSDGDYGIIAYLHNVTEAKRISAAQISIWGTPWEKSHDANRGECTETWASCPVEGTPKPFLRLPSSCQNPLTSTMSFSTWAQPPTFAATSDTEAAPVGCEAPPFDPTIEAKPSTNVADSPSGLHVDLHLPQEDNEDSEGLGEADLKDATVSLPTGLTVNPSSANGLEACSLAQIGYQGLKEGKPSFSTEPADCPDAAKIGTVEIDAPAVDHPLPGSLYLAKQGENPFNSLLALYIAVNDPETGVVIKLPGRVETDPVTGQITNTFEQNPQLPFEDLKVDLFEGARAPLRTPQTCGESATTPSFTTTTSLVPWTAPAGLTAHPSDSFAMAHSPSGGACVATKAALPNAPFFEAGSESPIAGAYSPFVLTLAREDGSQELKGLNVTLPPGMAAKFAGVAECSDAAIASAESKTGKQEQSAPSCPSASHLGTVTVGAGAGPAPYYVKGKAYLAGPYKGAPLSTAIITPAVAGPFDLGAVVVRAPLYIDPETAQGTVKSSFPTILQGIPLDIRSIAVSIDRQDFTLNPTSCEAKAVTGEAISTQGQSVQLNNRFQVGGCANLGFKPKLSLALKGGTKRGAHPALTATLTYPKGGAYSNIAYAQVALPHSEFLDQGHIGTVCTRVQFAANQCPAKSVYGYAKAITPLFDKPLEGPVYLRSSSHQLPDLVAALNGQVNVVLAGRNDSIHGGIRNTFEAVPDAPVSKFTLKLKGAKKGLLQNSTDICAGTHKANARFVAHNGKVVVLRPELQAKCGGKAKQHNSKHGKGDRR